MSLLRVLLRTSWRAALLAILAAAASGAGGVGLIALVNRELNRTGPADPRMARLFFVACLLVAASRVLAQSITARLGQSVVSSISLDLCRRIAALPFESFERLDRSRLLTVLTQDITIVGAALIGFPQVALNLPVIAACVIYAGYLSPAILACGLAYAGVAVGVYILVVDPAMSRLQVARAGQDTLLAHYRTLIDGFRELKQHRARREAFLNQRLAPSTEHVRDRTVAAQRAFAFAEGWGEIAFFGFLGLLLYVVPDHGGRGSVAGAVLLTLYVMGPLDVLLTWIPTLGRARVSLTRVESLVESLPDPQDARHAVDRPALLRQLELCGVTYEYPTDGSAPGFRLGPIELEIRPGEVVMLAGGNGSGKTTLVKLLTGLYAPHSGTIELDGRPIAEADREAYRQLFSVTFADAHLFDDLAGLPADSLEAEARSGLSRLGLDEIVSFTGTRFSTLALSQGQRGRIALLTLLLEDRPVCVFDEWAANQDARARGAFYREVLPALREAGKAVLVITHDERYFDAADRVLRLCDGKLDDDWADRADEVLGFRDPCTGPTKRSEVHRS